jgi:hypothetical protein
MLWERASMTDSANPKKPGNPTTSSSKRDAWEKNTLQPTLAKSPERQKEFTTVSSYPIRRLYTEEDLSGWNPARVAITLGSAGRSVAAAGIRTDGLQRLSP